MTYGFWEEAYAGSVSSGRRAGNGTSWGWASDNNWKRETFMPDSNGGNSFFNQTDLSGGPAQTPQTPPEPDNALQYLRANETGQARSQVDQPRILKKIKNFLNEIWVNILLNSGDIPGSVMISSANRGEGVTFVSFHMALFLALEHNRKILYVDTNINKKHKQFFNFSNSPGLSHYLRGEADVASVIYNTNYGNLYIVPSGYENNSQAGAASMYPDEKLKNFVEYCEGNFDMVIFDGQAMINSPEMISFARLVDQCVLVCRYAITRREVALFILDKLKKSKVNIAGMVLNRRQYPIPTPVYRLMK
jgi:Mrp family chromosome partitioning ATPase